MKKMVIFVVVLAIILAILALTFFGGDTSSEETNETENEAPQEESSRIEESLWYSSELTDVNSGETFTISQLNDKPILLESFAVWCPTCTRQQKEIKSFHEEVGDTVVSISLDTDPNEDEAKILEHTQQNGFDWIYAVSPPEITQSLIDDFGVGVVNAPSAPVILICPNGMAKKLERGVKDVSDLKESISSCQA